MGLLATRPGCCAGLRAAAEDALLGYEATIERAFKARWLLSAMAKASDDVLLMSRKHCHARDVSSIVVDRWPRGSLVRLFLTWPGHQLAENRPGSLTVGIHDHRYSVVLWPIHGDVVNVTYRRKDYGDIRVFEWRFRSGVADGKPTAIPVGLRGLVEAGRRTLSGSGETIDHDVYHTIECAGMCAWEVIEGRNVKEETTLFTDSGSPIVADDLYEKFSDRREVVRHVEGWIRLAGLDQ